MIHLELATHPVFKLVTHERKSNQYQSQEKSVCIGRVRSFCQALAGKRIRKRISWEVPEKSGFNLLLQFFKFILLHAVQVYSKTPFIIVIS